MESARLKLLPRLLAAGFLFAAGPLWAAPPAEKRNTDFSQVLPAGGTAGVFVAENFFKYAAFDEKSPMARLIDHPTARLWFAQILPSRMPKLSSLEESLGLTAKDLPRLFSGKAAMAIVMRPGAAPAPPPEAKPTPKPADSDDDDDDDGPVEPTGFSKFAAEMGFEIVVLAEYLGSPAEFEELATKAETDLRRDDTKADIKRERVEGLVLRSFETSGKRNPDGTPHTLYCALAEGTIIFATSRDLLLDTVHGLARGVTANPLSGRSDYLAVKKEMGASDGFLFVNLDAVMPKARELLARELADSTKENPTAKLMVDPKAITDTIALENFSALYGSLTISEERMELRYGLTWKDRVGLATLLNFGRNPVALPAYASADYKAVEVTTIDYPATWEAGEHLFRTASPGAYAAVGIALATQPEVQGGLVKVRTGILENLEPETVTLTGFPTATPAEGEVPGRAYIMLVKDPAAAQAGIEAAFNLRPMGPGRQAAKPEVREYLGVKMYQFPYFGLPTAPPPPDDEDDDKADKSSEPPDANRAPDRVRAVYAFVGNRLIVSVGADGFIEGVIANLLKPGRPLADGKLKDDLGDIPGTPCGITYGDVATFLLIGINETLRTGGYEQAGLSRADVVQARRAAKDLHYYWVGKTYYSPGGVYGRLFITEDKNPTN